MKSDKDIQELHQIKLDEIVDPLYYLERENDYEATAELAESMKSIGMINAITVRRLIEGYRIVTGAHRLKAARYLEWKTISARIIKCSKEEELSFTLAENINRTDLDPISVAFLISEIIEQQGLTQTEVAEKFGKSQAWIAAKLKLLSAPPEILFKVGKGEISESVATEVLRIDDDEVLEQALDKVEKRGMSVQATKEMVQDYRETGTLEPEVKRQEELSQEEDTTKLFMTECAIDHHEIKISETAVVRLCKDHFEMIRKMLMEQQLDFFRL